SNALQAADLTRLFIAILHGYFGILERQILIATRNSIIDLNMVRAVHRLHIKLDIIVTGHIKDLTSEHLSVTRSLIEFATSNVRNLYPCFAILFAHLTHKVIQQTSNNSSTRGKQRQTWTNKIREYKQIKLLAKFAMIALLGELYIFKICI